MTRQFIYVAGPMSGYPAYNYPAFMAAEKALHATGRFNVLNPARNEDNNPTPGVPQSWDWYMREALVQVAAADSVALLPGWECSRGARLEVHVAHALAMPTAPLDVWLSGGAS